MNFLKDLRRRFARAVKGLEIRKFFIEVAGARFEVRRADIERDTSLI